MIGSGTDCKCDAKLTHVASIERSIRGLSGFLFGMTAAESLLATLPQAIAAALDLGLSKATVS
jgi:hypothetical protein